MINEYFEHLFDDFLIAIVETSKYNDLGGKTKAQPLLYDDIKIIEIVEMKLIFLCNIFLSEHKENFPNFEEICKSF